MNRSRKPIIIVLILSLLGVHLTRRWAIASRASHAGAAASSAAGLSRMNSFALALMLGGLRGPLVMFLWPSAERQKNERNLEDFDTKIEWIRLLQAEFDSVHIFQIWNKAYNISVQMANVGNKYITILDALDYARNVDAERPNNINILSAIGQLYAEKLGRSAEKQYYRQRVREETQARQPMVKVSVPTARRGDLEKAIAAAGLPPSRMHWSTDDAANVVSAYLPRPLAEQIRPGLSGGDITFTERAATDSPGRRTLRRRELDPVLNPDGTILPRYLVGSIPRPSDLPADSEWNDGSELQYLKQFEPFNYGVSPLALGYNYYKRAQVLQEVNKQKHVQVTESVIARNPAVALRDWSAEEWEYGRRAEIEGLLATIPPTEREDLESPTTETLPDAQIAYRPLIDEAIFSYSFSDRIIDAAVTEYRRYLVSNKNMYSVYLSHVDELLAQQELVRADRDFLKLILEQENQGLRDTALAHYRQGVRRYQILLLKYFISDELVTRMLPPNTTKANLDEANLESDTIEQAIAAAVAEAQAGSNEHDYDALRQFTRYISRAQARMSNLGS